MGNLSPLSGDGCAPYHFSNSKNWMNGWSYKPVFQCFCCCCFFFKNFERYSSRVSLLYSVSLFVFAWEIYSLFIFKQEVTVGKRNSVFHRFCCHNYLITYLPNVKVIYLFFPKWKCFEESQDAFFHSEMNFFDFLLGWPMSRWTHLSSTQHMKFSRRSAIWFLPTAVQHHQF